MYIYKLDNVKVALNANNAELLEQAVRILEYKNFILSKGSHDLALKFSDHDRATENSGILVTPLGSQIKVWKYNERYVIEQGYISVVVDTSILNAVIYFSSRDVLEPFSAKVDLSVALSLSLAMLMHQLGYYGLHAVGLVHDETGYLFSGSSDSGKSTTALALVRQGWDYLSDDSLFIHVTAGHNVRAIGARRDFCVDPDAAEFFPELSERMWPAQQNDPDKWSIDATKVYDTRAIPTCEPRVLFFPEVGSCDESRLEPISPADAMARLVQQSAFSLYRYDRTAGAHFTALGHLVKQCSIRRLILGRDVIENPKQFSELLLSVGRER